jgi:hypothetical protein
MRRLNRLFALSVLAMGWAVLPWTGLAQTQELPSGFGISADHPKDEGIDRHPAVLFAESFERGGVGQLEERWQSVSNQDGKVVSLHDDSPQAAEGRRCVQLTANVPENEGGHLYKKLPREVDQAFARFYVKFPEDAGYIHHFVHFGGYRPATDWPQGGAGRRPRGDERMTVGIEPTGQRGKRPPPGVWNLYPYWHEMKPSVGNKYWGNSIQPTKPAVVPRDRWQCVELMMKCNTPGKRDGELALWLDGEVAMHIKQGTPRGEWTGMGFELLEEGGEPFEGFSWRTTDKLKINFFWLLHYVTEVNQGRNKVDEPAKPVTVWFDNIVISEKYVGPIKAGP